MMKVLLKYILHILLIGVFINLSCKKETSCEGCRENNKPPTALAGPDQVITLPTDSISLDGSASNDPDGTISDWLWKKISGPASFNIINASGSATVVNSLVAGIYKFELTVIDISGLFATDTVMVTVSSGNQPPIANAGGDITTNLPVNIIILDGSASTDPDNNIASYTWSKISGPSLFNIINATGVQTQVTNLAKGVYQFELKVLDDGGLFSMDTVQITVLSSNQPPVANAGNDITVSFPANAINLDGSKSTDPDNNIIGYQWIKIFGPSASNITNSNAVQTQVTNLTAGAYQFELTVTDAGGLFAKDTVQVIIMNPPPPCTDCKIVFVSDRDGNNEIYSCNVNGSNIQRLTNDVGHDDHPAWSPDGKYIAFISDRTGNPELYIMNAEGSNPVRKTFSGSLNPAWSPDGTRIMYTTLSNGSSNIWVVGATGGPPSLLFEAQGWEGYPAWSPDGTKIALVSDWAAYDFVYDIYTINADGTNFNALTTNIFDRFDYLYPSWSPNGTKLAMAISETIGINQYNTQVGVMNPDGSGLKSIMSNAAPWTRTSWSGDGNRIVYTSLFDTRLDVSWVSADGSASGTIVTNGWNADWQH